MNYSRTIGLAAVLGYAQAAIKTTGLWTGEDWYNADVKIGVENGIPYSNDATT